jgi:hypothetical protein
LGQRQDHTAIPVVEKADTAVYARVVERVRKLTAHPAMTGRCSVVVDATGVGGPVVERLVEAELPCDLRPVTITGGGEPLTGAGGAYRKWT